MDLGLAHKRALVTGSSAGLGRAIAEMLAAEGTSVVVHGRDSDRTHAVAAAIRANGGDAMAVLGDLATDEGAAAVAHAAGDVDILVNNAGYYDGSLWTDLSSGDWTRIHQINVVSVVRMIGQLVPGMRQRGWGRIIQIGGGLAVQPVAEQPHYSATLAARHNLTVSLARELSGTGVTANIVAPGAILTDSTRGMVLQAAAVHGWGPSWADVESAAAATWFPNDVGRLGRPEEIAAAVCFLASVHADYITGADLRVDGGTVRNVT
ncbi:SDR family NAD(P)-dependent oxidoreductase [Mycolicibacterium aichiense]|uniref:3-oxoacyl-[acyl-carrier-protein] reductase MabA n=1 Tax=Mycolicibacterium aichiense TaxID=1799 RepID=A0AAD1HK59_9MYCO|nr:SDR family NAD(P)-dependent oxidoreductase [Mycolicibacterium aichiense]MCV7019744.1 SDR family NAD(P)-dependent oxidoreductase [Mycolicibacterium aichiense]BBX06883.1 3-oxoacyl-ACP reductase [Mycolicibacterium aichiense]STZ80700.1 short-chain dehydrogenase/reductase SDR [Mycolicibacterium aichiense]